MPLFKYFGNRAAKCYLENQTVRFCQPQKYNDPFEIAPEIRVSHAVLSDEISIDIDISGGLSEMHKYEISDDNIDTYQFNQKTDFVEQISAKIGTTCFSNSTAQVPINLLMWAHYADSHQGIAIQLKDDCEINCQLAQITYREKRPILDGNKLFKEGYVPLRDLYVKSIHWQYESEFRMAKKLTDCQNILDDIFVAEIHPSNLERIVLGVNSSAELKKLAFQFHKKFQVEVIFTRRATSGFGFEPYTTVGINLSKAIELFKNYSFETNK